MAFDGIVAKKVIDELSILKNYKIDKIYQPDKNTIILGLYGNFTNVALLACISSNNYRVHLTTHTIKNPNIAPNFCMLLRKHILGYKIKKIYTKSLERIIYIDLANEENPEKPIFKTLIIELMGKHSNIVLVDSNNTIIDGIRHTSTEENAQRDIYPTARYYSPKVSKKNLLEISNFDDFFKSLFISDESDIIQSIANTFNGISYSNLKFIANNINTNSSYSSSKLFTHKVYDEIVKIINSNRICANIEPSKKDYYVSVSTSAEPFVLNFSLDDFYYSKESNELFTNYRNTLLNIILSTLKKYEKRLNNIDDKLSECADMDKYKLYGELITANLYKIPNKNIKEITLENYYDNDKPITISLDDKYLPSINAKKFYKKYTKLKNTLEIVTIQKEETISELQYLESIIYELECCDSIEEISEILDELSENEIFKEKINSFKNKRKYEIKKSNFTKNKNISFNPIKYKIDDFTFLVGRNNKENDYITLKYAKKTDLWFHTKDIHGSHAILILDNRTPNHDILNKCAEITAFHSKAKHSSNVPVDYCEVKYVKKPNKAKPGMVIYKNNSTLYVNPKI